MSKETEQKISQLQLIEQNMQNFLMQKQQLQARPFLRPRRPEPIPRSSPGVKSIESRSLIAFSFPHPQSIKRTHHIHNNHSVCGSDQSETTTRAEDNQYADELSTDYVHCESSVPVQVT